MADGSESWYTQYIYDAFLIIYLSTFVAVVVGGDFLHFGASNNLIKDWQRL